MKLFIAGVVAAIAVILWLPLLFETLEQWDRGDALATIPPVLTAAALGGAFVVAIRTVIRELRK